jgi:uncharacterized protein (TIGR03437 family)
MRYSPGRHSFKLAQRDTTVDSRILITLFTISAGIACAQPRIDLVQNNYSYLLPNNPNYGIAQGSIFIIKGANLANTTTGLQNPPLPKVLNGVTATVTVSGTTREIFWYYVTPGQLGGVLPSNTPVGTGTLTVTNSTGTSAPASIKVVESAFGTISLDGSGTGQAAAFNLRSILTPSDSARPGETIVLYGSGLGPINGDDSVPPAIANLPSPISIEIGGLNAAISYHGRSTFAALDQINVVVPTGVTPGCNVPVVVTTGQYASNITTIPVAANGGQCPAPSGGGSSEGIEISQAEINSWVAAGQYRTGSVGLTRQWRYATTDVAGSTSTSLIKSDVLTASFNRISGADLPRLLNPQITPPTPGQCTVYIGTIQNPFPNLTYTSLDAGPAITVSGSAGVRTAPRSRNSVGMISYASDDLGNYIDPGRFTISGTGGPDVGAFSGSINVAPDLQWTNRPSLGVVDRGQPLTVQWSGGEPSTLVTMQGTSVVANGPVASFGCTARNTDRQFTVPPSILGQLPASPRISAGTVSILLRGTLAIASVGTGARVTASGVDYFTLGNQWGIAQSAEYK